jgi:hypothetical protein
MVMCGCGGKVGCAFLSAQGELFAPDSVVGSAFSTPEPFSEFVKTAEGIPRDGMGVLGYAAQYAGEHRISRHTFVKQLRSGTKRTRHLGLAVTDAQRLCSSR